jgi:type IX secretion system PorP/SprF family membrane protein
MKKAAFTAIICILLYQPFKAQDIVFSQFFLNSLQLNPAVAGSANEPRIFLNYRNQWPDFGNTFVSYQGSYDQYLKPLHGGIGLNIVRDNVGGYFNSTNIDIIYSHRTRFSQFFTLQSGLQASFIFQNVNPGFLGASMLLNTKSTTQPDFSVGFLGITRNSQIGLSFHHLNSGYLRFNYNFIKSPLKISLFYTKNIKIMNERRIADEGYIISPAILLEKQGQSIMFNYGIGITKNVFFAGIYARNNLPFQFTSAIFSLGLTFENYRFGYSYDYSLPSIYNYMPMTGAHELTMVITFPIDPKRNRYAPISCPDFKVNY